MHPDYMDTKSIHRLISFFTGSKAGSEADNVHHIDKTMTMGRNLPHPPVIPEDVSSAWTSHVVAPKGWAAVHRHPHLKLVLSVLQSPVPSSRSISPSCPLFRHPNHPLLFWFPWLRAVTSQLDNTATDIRIEVRQHENILRDVTHQTSK